MDLRCFGFIWKKKKNPDDKLNRSQFIFILGERINQLWNWSCKDTKYFPPDIKAT